MHFSPVLGKPNKAKCDTCGYEYSYSDGSTSNLALHIRTKHPSLANELPQRKKQKITPCTPSSSTSSNSVVENTVTVDGDNPVTQTQSSQPSVEADMG